MNINESIQQLETLIEAWQLNEADLNQTDINAIQILLEENQKLKKQLEELELQNFNLREDIMIKKMSLPNEEIKDKTFFDLYNIPSYEDLLNQQKEFINYLQQKIIKSKCQNDIFYVGMQRGFELSLQKYKEIVGD